MAQLLVLKKIFKKMKMSPKYIKYHFAFFIFCSTTKVSVTCFCTQISRTKY